MSDQMDESGDVVIDPIETDTGGDLSNSGDSDSSD